MPLICPKTPRVALTVAPSLGFLRHVIGAIDRQEPCVGDLNEWRRPDENVIGPRPAHGDRLTLSTGAGEPANQGEKIFGADAFQVRGDAKFDIRATVKDQPAAARP